MNRSHPSRPMRALALLAAVSGAIAASACLAGPALASPAGPDGWSTQAQVPNISSSLAPSEATSGSTLYVAYTTSKGGISYAIYTTGWWPKIRSVSGTGVTPSTTLSPAITVFDGHLYAFWINSSAQLRYSYLNGTTWQPTQTVGSTSWTAESSATPAVAVASGELWVAYKGHTSGNIYYTETGDGTTWGSQETAIKSATSLAPALAPTGLSAAPLAFAWTNSSDGIGYGILGFLGFENLGTVPDAGTNAAPALDFMSAATGGNMYVAWKGHTTNKVFFNEVPNFMDSSFGPSSWIGQATLPVALTSTTPAIIDSGTTLWSAYKALHSDNILYEGAVNPTS
jgi:hypothetical protein